MTGWRDHDVATTSTNVDTGSKLGFGIVLDFASRPEEILLSTRPGCLRQGFWQFTVFDLKGGNRLRAGLAFGDVDVYHREPTMRGLASCYCDIVDALKGEPLFDLCDFDAGI